MILDVAMLVVRFEANENLDKVLLEIADYVSKRGIKVTVTRGDEITITSIFAKRWEAAKIGRGLGHLLRKHGIKRLD